nr:SPOR domain-containing protein [uncultured Treponema sp.]
MKKLFSGLLVFLLAVTMFADSKDVVEGVIEVADEGKFPAGHFGQAAGYLPGDSIFVSNPATGVTLQFLNLGTLDSAEGVAVLLSKESAKTLGLDKDKNVRCKLNMRYGSFDESVVGQAVIDESDAARMNDKKENAELAKADVEVPAEEKAAEPVAVEEIPAETVEAVAEETVPAAGVPLIEEEEISEETVEDIPAETEEAVAVAVESEEEIIEDYEMDDEDFAGTKKAVEAPSPAEIAEVEEEKENAAEEIVTEEAVAAEAVTEEAVAEEAVNEEIIAEEVPAEEKTAPVVEESVLAEVETKPVEEEIVAEDEEYAPIVLVPTEKVVPETTPAETVEIESTMSSREETAVSVVPVAESAAENKIEVAETRTASPKTSFEKYIVESESLLPKNRWYVQIASYGNVENIEKTVSKYSKYPLNLVPNGKGAYRVIVGPLNEDEYASVLKKFKAFGFKDAFLRKK